MLRSHFWIGIALLLASSGSYAQRFIVTDDAFGNTSAKALSEVSDAEVQQALERIEGETPDQVDATDEAAPSPESASSTPTATEISSVTSSSAEALPVDSPQTEEVSPELVSEPLEADAEYSSQVTENSAEPAESITNQSAIEPSQAPVSENPFERALRESQENETDEVVKRLRAQGGDRGFDITEVNPADFVDSEDLLQGNVNSAGERPFYVTFDNEGESNVIFYSPQVIEEEIERRKTQERVSDAVIHSVEDVAQPLNLPASADPVAASILSGGNKPSYFERFSERCCERLPNVGIMDLRLDKGLHVALDREDFSYRFVDGDSRYRLIRIPNVQQDFLLTIKTFVRRYKNLGIDSGAFIPQVVLLDRDKRPLRVISDISMESHAETWSSYGYLKSVIEVKQASIDAEVMLLVYTRAADLRRTSTIEDANGAWSIRHMEVGSLEISAVENTISARR